MAAFESFALPALDESGGVWSEAGSTLQSGGTQPSSAHERAAGGGDQPTLHTAHEEEKEGVGSSAPRAEDADWETLAAADMPGYEDSVLSPPAPTPAPARSSPTGYSHDDRADAVSDGGFDSYDEDDGGGGDLEVGGSALHELASLLSEPITQMTHLRQKGDVSGTIDAAEHMLSMLRQLSDGLGDGDSTAQAEREEGETSSARRPTSIAPLSAAMFGAYAAPRSERTEAERLDEVIAASRRLQEAMGVSQPASEAARGAAGGAAESTAKGNATSATRPGGAVQAARERLAASFVPHDELATTSSAAEHRRALARGSRGEVDETSAAATSTSAARPQRAHASPVSPTRRARFTDDDGSQLSAENTDVAPAPRGMDAALGEGNNADEQREDAGAHAASLWRDDDETDAQTALLNDRFPFPMLLLDCASLPVALAASGSEEYKPVTSIEDACDVLQSTVDHMRCGTSRVGAETSAEPLFIFDLFDTHLSGAASSTLPFVMQRCAPLLLTPGQQHALLLSVTRRAAASGGTEWVVEPGGAWAAELPGWGGGDAAADEASAEARSPVLCTAWSDVSEQLLAAGVALHTSSDTATLDIADVCEQLNQRGGAQLALAAAGLDVPDSHCFIAVLPYPAAMLDASMHAQLTADMWSPLVLPCDDAPDVGAPALLDLLQQLIRDAHRGMQWKLGVWSAMLTTIGHAASSGRVGDTATGAALAPPAWHAASAAALASSPCVRLAAALLDRGLEVRAFHRTGGCLPAVDAQAALPQYALAARALQAALQAASPYVPVQWAHAGSMAVCTLVDMLDVAGIECPALLLAA